MSSYDFGRFRLDAVGHLLYRDEERVQLTPKAVDVLLTLVENDGKPVAREDLLHRVWSNVAVEEGTLSSHISVLRKALGEGFIETIPKRGYRFASAVRISGTAGRSLLAVLPFENLSGKKSDDAFSDGLTEEMITQLGRMDPARLGVIARTSAMTYKSTQKTIEQIGRELGVSHVLEGSVRRAGRRVRISAQLIQVSDQTHVWADNYESEIEDILGLQARVARAVAMQIQTHLLPRQSTRRVVPEAYEAYVQGRYVWNRRNENDLFDSIRFFEKAIEKDPAYAQPYVGLADAYLSLMDYGYIALADAIANARPMALKALELDDSTADAHVSLGHAAFHEFDFPTAAIQFDRALELNPNSFTARYYRSNFLLAMSRNDEATSEAEEARRLDPVSPAANSNLISILWFSQRYDEAAALAKKMLTLYSDNARVYEDLGRAFEQMGRVDEAIKMLRKSIALGGGVARTSASLAHAYAVAGRREEAMKILRTLQKKAETTYVPAYDFALIFTGLGEHDEAFAWLSKAYEERSSALPFIKNNPRLAPLRRDPRFRRLLRRVGLAH